VAGLAAGRNNREVAETLGVAPSSVSRIGRRFTEQGVLGLYDKRSGNGSSKVTNEFRRRVAELLKHSPEDFGWSRPTWTRELLSRQMQWDGWPAVSVCTMGRTLAQLGARLGVPKPVVLCPWPRDARMRRLAEIRRIEQRATPTEPVLYVDEVDIHLNPRIGRDWMLKGHQRRIVTPGQNEKFYLAGALDVCTGKLITTGAERKDAALFIQLLWQLATRYRAARRIHLILDNYGIHSAATTQRVLAQLGGKIVLHFLPPYCPDSNRIERVWQDMHANVTRNHRCKSMTELLDKARRYLDSYAWRRAANPPALRRATA
jgi:transposase